MAASVLLKQLSILSFLYSFVVSHSSNTFSVDSIYSSLETTVLHLINSIIPELSLSIRKRIGNKIAATREVFIYGFRFSK
jgi:hypothetical protein